MPCSLIQKEMEWGVNYFCTQGYGLTIHLSEAEVTHQLQTHRQLKPSINEKELRVSRSQDLLGFKFLVMQTWIRIC